MGWLNLSGLLIAVCFVAWVCWRVARYGHSPVAGRRASGIRGVLPICSQAELVFLRVLESVMPDDLRVMCKVRVADVIDTFGADFRSVSQKHFDFVICRSDTLQPLLAIELDDRSHLTPAAQKRDAVKNAVCQVAGLPILRIICQAEYEAGRLAHLVNEALDPSH